MKTLEQTLGISDNINKINFFFQSDKTHGFGFELKVNQEEKKQFAEVLSLYEERHKGKSEKSYLGDYGIQLCYWQETFKTTKEAVNWGTILLMFANLYSLVKSGWLKEDDKNGFSFVCDNIMLLSLPK